ncbi:MAG: hypothetical protein N3G20_08605 [Verrucomicrobiae bacterium]|nr:hypothetical protein [Verrucomicrobiae bacterium]
MNEPDYQLDKLRRLLAIKRYERPPHGHLDRLAERIRRALEAEALSPRATWWERFISRFDMRPAVAAAVALFVAALYLCALALPEQSRPRVISLQYPVSQDWVIATDPMWVLPRPVAASPVELPAPSSPTPRSSVHPIIGMQPVQGFLYTTMDNGVRAINSNVRVP